VLNVFVRDVGQFVNILLQFWFWFTPIVYVSKTLPEWVSGLLAYNPMATIIGSYQNVMLYHQSPNWMALLPVTVLSVILFLFAWRLFKNMPLILWTRFNHEYQSSARRQGV
jgi:lipopolysaccharide transport system permease protein